MEAINKPSNCSGCGACKNICPVDAISMCHTLEGTYPEVDKGKCIQCGLCVKVCPIEKDLQNDQLIFPIVYACKLKDSETLKNSTSGGVFMALAREIIKEKGVVFGAVSGADFKVRICAAETEEELKTMQGSKYVESNTEDSFREVEKKLQEGIPCLYTALPCQIAGLLSYLEVRGKKYDNLYTADLVCHGTPSEKIYLSYLEEYEKKNGVKLREVRHRYKDRKWDSMVPQNCMYVSENGKIDVHNSFQDGYLNGFLQGKIYKNNCYECKYAMLPRKADFTLADFTGLGAVKKYKNDYKEGVSQFLVNTEKGKQFFDRLKEALVVEERSLYEAMFFNKNLWKPSKKPKETEQIFKDFEAGMTWDELREKYFDKNTNNKRVNTIKQLIPKIFGAETTVKVMYHLKKKQMSPETAIRELEEKLKN